MEEFTIKHDHWITWRFVPGELKEPIATVTCKVPFIGSRCWDAKGPWAEQIDLDEGNPTECYAAAWLNAQDAALLWSGTKGHVGGGLTGEIVMHWDGADWIWWFIGEERMEYPWIENVELPELSDPGEIVGA
jgi:hypothetical protein